jgi:predicted transcriptional regulator
MTTTTIKVTRDVRDRLKAQASAAHRTLGEHLAHLAELGDREHRFAVLREAIAATPADALESYQAEVAAWERLDRE